MSKHVVRYYYIIILLYYYIVKISVKKNLLSNCNFAKKKVTETERTRLTVNIQMLENKVCLYNNVFNFLNAEM